MTYRSVSRTLLVLALLGALGVFTIPQPVGAVWHIVLSERFAGSSLTWPWGSWTISPNRPPSGSGPPYSWGVQDTYYKFNGLDTHSLWCCGQPNSLDPFQDYYPPNTNSWVKWGPINLSQAVAAQANFWYYCKTEPLQDYVRWGAYPSNTFNMYEYDRRSGINMDWMNGFLDFDSLANGTQSMLGQSQVYIVFQFVADGDAQTNIGAFIDEINIAWDDGMLDLEAKSPFFQDMDSVTVLEPLIGDSLFFVLTWTAAGSGTTPPFNIKCYLDGNLYSTERRNVHIGTSMVVWEKSYSTPWVVDADPHTVSWMLDADSEVSESIETNNDTSLTFTGIPPNDPPWIQLTNPVEGDSATDEFLITWEDQDNNHNAEIYLYWDNDTLEYNGNSIPGGYALPEDDTTDAYLWDVSSMIEGPVWVLAFITDGFESMWDYSPGPLYIHHPQPPNVPPTIQILHPTNGDTARTNSYAITWVDSDPDDNASIDLYWDIDNTGFDGTPIPGAANILENNMLNSYTWGISSMDDGVYWVYASIADDDTTVWTYSQGPLVIDRVNGVITPYRPGSIPGQFTLESVYPNPFNSSTNIRLGLSHADFVQMSIYDNLGRLCAEPFKGRLEAGYFEVSWSPAHLPSGIYLIEVRTSDALQRSKAVFLK